MFASELRFISWNLNGLNAALDHGLLDFIQHTEADIYAFQETKVADPEIPITGYYSYASSCKTRSGYSGTMCLTRYKPLAVSYDFYQFAADSLTHWNDIDIEGRVITLEFQDFFFINCYFPSPLRNRKRYDYRSIWDKQFLAYVEALLAQKAVIICGDFNVTVSADDAHKADYNYDGYETTEHESVMKFLALGFVDAFRFLHPHTKHVYSWWSGKDKNRSDNRGRRLDYFLVSKSIASFIRTSSVMREIYGSDHCPITLSIRLHIAHSFLWEPQTDNRPQRKRQQIVRKFPNGSQHERNLFAEQLRITDYGSTWSNIDWDDVENRVARMQKTLTFEIINGNDKEWSNVIILQNAIINAIDARLLAVRHVCSANSIPGVDNVKWTSAMEKMTAAISLNKPGYKASPARIIVVQSKNGKIRHIHINTWYDRAMQALYAMALDPIAEARADRTSFAFRKGRSHLDLHFYLERGFQNLDWAFVADVKQCYESISHNWIEEHIPLNKAVLHEFISAGYILNGQLYQPDEGVGIGMNISPIIANMVLDGLQEFLVRKLFNGISFETWRQNNDSNGEMYRYADDIIVLTRTKQEAERVRDYLIEFLEPRGLELSSTKSRVVDIREGFDFMSRTYVKKHGRVYSYPSEAAITLFMKELKATVKYHKGSQRSLIEILNHKLIGWATYHKIGNAHEAFNKIDIYLKALLLEACEEKHPKWTREKVLEKYWYQDQCGIFQYALPHKREVHVKSLSNIVLIPHKGVWLKVNPYIHTDYLNWRMLTRAIRSISGPYKAVWDRQKGRCYYCGYLILPDQERTLISIDPKAGRVNGSAYIHSKCTQLSVDFVKTDIQPESNMELMNLLQRLSKFRVLSEFFRNSTASSIRMKFSEVEALVSPEILAQQRWWTRDDLSKAWTDNGYEIARVDTKNKRLTFKRVNKRMSNVEIPEIFFTRKIPDEAKYELENYCRYIIEKYEL